MSLFFTANSAFASKPKVSVIGAGLAGLTAAYRLQKEGMDVDLYEARNRVGGRVLTITLNDKTIELGAQNISDGGDALHMKNLINEYGFELDSVRVNLNHLYFNGKELTPENEFAKYKNFDPQHLRKQLNELALISRNMKELIEKIVDPKDPLYKVLNVRLAAYEGATVDKLSTVYVDTLYHILLGGVCSVHQGGIEEKKYVDFESIKGGNALLTEKIAESLGKRVHLNMPLTKVAKNRDGSFKLSFRDGQDISTDVLVLATPCSVYENIDFEDGIIPTDRLNAIKSIQYGTNAKIIVPFSVAPTSRPVLLNDQIISFFNDAQSTLIVYFTDDASLFSNSTIQNSYSMARPMIENGFKDSCPKFTVPLCAEDKNFKSYHTAVGYSWPNDPYVKGSYSYISPGQETMLLTIVEEDGEKFKNLFTPIQRRLYFAGEHASILLDVPGTMEAACESGNRVARAILKVGN